MNIHKIRRVHAGFYKIGGWLVERESKNNWWVRTSQEIYPPECYTTDSYADAKALATSKANKEYILKVYPI